MTNITPIGQNLPVEMLLKCDKCGYDYFVSGADREAYDQWFRAENKLPFHRVFPAVNSSQVRFCESRVCDDCVRRAA